ncbi:MAG: hypothetical protein GY928_29015 [Colwellia sp.]|nr:hypothetical protein [Colwellia sp.]
MHKLGIKVFLWGEQYTIIGIVRRAIRETEYILANETIERKVKEHQLFDKAMEVR